MVDLDAIDVSETGTNIIKYQLLFSLFKDTSCTM